MKDDVFLFAEFCDDIRQEIGYKQTLIGIYSGRLVVEKFPVVLPKIGIFVHVFLRADYHPSMLKVRAKLNDEILGELEIPPESISEELREEARSSSLGRIVFAAILMLSPIVFQESCKLKVEAETENGITPGSSLKISEQTNTAVQ